MILFSLWCFDLHLTTTRQEIQQKETGWLRCHPEETNTFWKHTVTLHQGIRRTGGLVIAREPVGTILFQHYLNDVGRYGPTRIICMFHIQHGRSAAPGKSPPVMPVKKIIIVTTPSLWWGWHWFRKMKHSLVPDLAFRSVINPSLGDDYSVWHSGGPTSSPIHLQGLTKARKPKWWGKNANDAPPTDQLRGAHKWPLTRIIQP